MSIETIPTDNIRLVTSIRIKGTPQPAGSKRAFPFIRPGKNPYKKGGIGVRVTDDNPNSAVWKRIVAGVAKMVYQESPVASPLAVEFRFTLARPKFHFGTGRNSELLKASAPTRPIVKPDVLKLARAAEDALTGIVWIDDAQIVDEFLSKRYGPMPGLVISVYELDAELF